MTDLRYASPETFAATCPKDHRVPYSRSKALLLEKEPNSSAMQSTVRVFVIPKERSPGGPPNAARKLHVDAPTIDGLHEAAIKKLVPRS